MYYTIFDYQAMLRFKKQKKNRFATHSLTYFPSLHLFQFQSSGTFKMFSMNISYSGYSETIHICIHDK